MKIGHRNTNEAPSTVAVDLTAIGSEGARNSVREALVTSGHQFHEYDQFWFAFGAGKTQDIPAMTLVFSDLSTLARRFADFDKHQWISSIRRVRPYFVTYVRTQADQKYADRVDDLLLASDLRVIVCRGSPDGTVRRCLEEAVASLDPNSISEVRYSAPSNTLWVVFGDGFSGVVSFQALGLADELPRLHPDSATVARGARAVEIATVDGELYHIDSASIRSILDPQLARTLSEEELATEVELGSSLRRYREAINVSQQELARRSGLGQGLISRLENGKHRPRFDTLSRYASGLGVSLQKLLDARDADPV